MIAYIMPPLQSERRGRMSGVCNVESALAQVVSGFTTDGVACFVAHSMSSLCRGVIDGEGAELLVPR